MRWIVLLFLLPALAHAKSTRECEIASAGEAVIQRLENNDFRGERDYNKYIEQLSAREIPSYSEFVNSTPKTGLYMDSGAAHALAVRQSLALDPNLHAVAFSYKKPANPGLDEDILGYKGRMEYVEGGKLEVLIADKTSRLFGLRGKISRLSELFGPLIYSDDIEAVFNAYADLLEVGGQALLHFWEMDTHFNVIDSSGRPYRATLRELSEFIPLVTGGRLQVRAARMQTLGPWPQFETSVLWLERVEGNAIPVHIFETTIRKDEAPPIRDVQVALPPGFHFDREASRKADLTREKTQFQHATVPKEFDIL